MKDCPQHPCIQYACIEGVCHPSYLKGASCSDGDKCNGEETCDGTGQCLPGTPLPVDDGKTCTIDLCDPATGTINHKGQPDCTCETDADCDDNNACTIDVCKLNGTGQKTCFYTNANAGTECDDKNKCTIGDKCDTGGKCQGSLIPVDDGNPCTADSCNPTNGNPVHTPSSGAACNDNNGCTLGDQCNAGTCQGTPKNVNDGNECTTDTCDPATGNVSHTPQPNCKPCKVAADCNDNNPCTTESCQDGKCAYANVASGTTCSDNNLCTDNDKCNGSGQCVGTPKICNTPPNVCLTSSGSCNQADGQCTYPLADNGTPCSDNNACTLNDACQAGTCVPGTPKTCNTPPNNQCYDSSGTCDPSNGDCSYNPKASGTNCNDGNACTENDECNGSGQCIGTPKICSEDVCKDNKLTTYKCEKSSGQCVEDTTACPGNHACEKDSNKCWSSCTQADNDERCAEGHYCEKSSGPCVPKRESGSACTHSVQCLSNSCVDEKCK
jgi:hypothetical protein